VQRDELESHLECATKSHLDLACGELRDTHEKLKEKITHFDRLEERVNILDEQLDKVTDIQHQHQYEVDSLQQQHQRRVDQLEQKVNTCQQQHQRRVDQLEQKVKRCQTKLEQKISMERTTVLVCLVLGLVFLTFYLHEKNLRMVKKDLEDRFQMKLGEKGSVIQSLHEKNLRMVKKDLEDRFQMKLEEKISVIQSLQEKNVDMVKKDLEDRFQMKLEEKVSVIQSLHEKNLRMVKKDLEDRFQMKLEEKVSVIQSLQEKNVDMVKKELSNKLLILEVDTEKYRSFIWKITSFKSKLRQGKNNEKKYIVSDPFYAYGYKLMLKLYPNGDGIGENTHLSIFVIVSKGEYDGMLPRFFSKQVTFTLFDQQDNQLNVAKGFTADFENGFISWWGFIKFVSHDHLWARRFVVNDTLFIKVQVDSPSDEM